VIGRILQHLEAGIALKHQAVLFRTAHHSDALEVELSRRNIPFVKYGGLKFLEAAHVKDAMSILRLAENPRDSISAARAIQLLDGFGPGHAKRVIAHLNSGHHDLKQLRAFQPPPAAGGSDGQWSHFVELLINLAPDKLPLPEQIAQVRVFYNPILEKRYEQAQVRARDLEQLEQWKKDLNNWGRWGKDDEIGTLNFITPAKRKQAAALVREGFSVSLASDADTEKAIDNPQPYEHEMLALGSDRIGVAFHGIAHTHLDSLAHINLVSAIEQEFAVRFALGELETLKNVGEMIHLIQQKLAVQ